MSTEDNSILKRNLMDIVGEINKINDYEKMIPQKTDFFFENPTSKGAEDIQLMQDEVKLSFEESINKVKSVIDSITEMEKKIKSESGEQTPPTPEDLKLLLRHLFDDSPKTVSPPIPNYCGCNVYKLKKAEPNQFICMNNNGLFKLMVVYRYTPETKTIFAIDPYDNSDPVNIIEIKENNWSYLPTLLPKKPNPRWEHALHKKVLSLKPTQNGWSNIFYPAFIKSRPSDKLSGSSDTERGYVLEFGDLQVNVPEQFVVYLPESWNV